jgi:tetratricopeptide (TPR) repeat protein
MILNRVRSLRGYLCVVALLLAGACSHDPELRKRQFFDSGNRYLDRGQVAEAIIEFRNAVQIDGRFGEARLKLAESYQRLGDTSNALYEYVRAADLLPDNLDLQLTACEYLVAGRRFDDARSLAESVLERQPQNVKAHTVLGQIWIGLDAEGSYAHRREAKALAERHLRQAVELDPTFLAGYEFLGHFYMSQGKWGEAARELQRAISLAPTTPVAANNLAWIYAEHGDNLTEALRLARIAADALPDRPEAQHTLGWVHYKQRNASQAVSVLQRAVSLAPPNQTYRYHLGLAYALQGDARRAREALDQALSGGPFPEAADARRVLSELPVSADEPNRRPKFDFSLPKG